VLEDVSWVLEKGRCLAFVVSRERQDDMLDLATGLLTPSSAKWPSTGVS